MFIFWLEVQTGIPLTEYLTISTWACVVPYYLMWWIREKTI